MTSNKNVNRNVTIRRATQDDSAKMACVHIASWKETYKGIIDEDFLNALDADEKKSEWDRGLKNKDLSAFVSIYQGAIVGFIAGGPPRNMQKNFDSEIYALYLLEDFHGEGIGYQMYKTFILNLSANKTLVWVPKDNPSKSFYERIGGSVVDQKNISIGEKVLVELAYSIITCESAALRSN